MLTWAIAWLIAKLAENNKNVESGTVPIVAIIGDVAIVYIIASAF